MSSFLIRNGLRAGVVRRCAMGWITSCALIAAATLAIAEPATTTHPPGAEATLAAIEACASENLPETTGVIGFRVEAVDRTGEVTTSRAELRWRKPPGEPTRVLLEVSEPAKTAGTALLIIDRQADQPEFFVRLPEMEKVRRIRSRRLRGPVLGTDFSYEDLERLREPLDRTLLELIGVEMIEGAATWVLETIPGEDDGSQYSRVLTYVDQETCLPARIDLFESGDRLRKRLDAPRAGFRNAGAGKIPHEFVMHDLRRKTRTAVEIERFDANADLPEERFTKAALQVPPAAR